MTNALLLKPHDVVRTALKERARIGQEILERKISDDSHIEDLRVAHDQWTRYNEALLRTLFESTELMYEYEHSRNPRSTVGLGRKADNWERLQRERLKIKGQIDCLESIVNRIELWPEVTSALSGEASPSDDDVDLTRAFVVHGHEEAPREAVARFLESLGIEPVILHEQANRGMTLIEKLEHYADVGFAVVLLTADDTGQSVKPGAVSMPRARQNVILELGYFVGRLGRERVCALYMEGLELPSDWDGVVWVGLDRRGSWKLELARELKTAGFRIDLNNVLR